LARKMIFFYHSLVFWWVFGPHSTKVVASYMWWCIWKAHSQPFVFWVISFEPFIAWWRWHSKYTPMGNQYLKLTNVWEHHSHWNWCPTTNQSYPKEKSLKKNSILLVLLFYLIFFTIKTWHMAPSKLTSRSTYNEFLVGPACVVGRSILNLLYCKVTHPNTILGKVGLILEFLWKLVKLI
jgi:hypothetical protein